MFSCLQGSITHDGDTVRPVSGALALSISLSFFFPQILFLSMTPYGIEYSLGQLGSAVPSLSPFNFLCTCNLFSSSSVWESEEALTLCNYCLAVTKTSLCYRHCFQHKFNTNSIPATMGKINSIATKTSTHTLVERLKYNIEPNCFTWNQFDRYHSARFTWKSEVEWMSYWCLYPLRNQLAWTNGEGVGRCQIYRRGNERENKCWKEARDISASRIWGSRDIWGKQ